jgi:hypothetical protein
MPFGKSAPEGKREGVPRLAIVQSLLATSGNNTARKPTLFIVGAPKCATSALATYLSAHPNIFLSEPKEPNYFARHLSVPGSFLTTQPWHADLNRYLNLFKAVPEGKLIIGEASTRYLRSVKALSEIKQFEPNARIIVALRNPLHLARSWHAQKVIEAQEPETDFERAWKLEAKRAVGGFPPGLTASDALCYRHIASVGTQVKNLLELFRSEQVLAIFFDDLKRDPRSCYEKVLRFLGVPSDGRTDFPVVNVRRQWRWPWIPRILAKSSTRMPRIMWHPLVQKYAIVSGVEAPLRDEFRKEIAEVFSPEIDLLEQELNVNLRHWRASI